MPHMVMEHEEDPKQKLISDLGDLSNVEVFNNQILVAVYIRPTRTKSGIYLSDKTVDEDRYQGKASLVVKLGPEAFKDDTGKWFVGADIKEGDWVALRPSDGWPVSVNGVPCRMIEDTAVRMKIDRPDRVW